MHPTPFTRRTLRTAIVALAALAVLALAAPAFAAAGWKAAPSGTSAALSGLAARGSLRCAVGAGGVIVVSTDAGATWSAQTPDPKQDLGAVAFADADHGWAVGAGGTILATVDGGLTWTPQASGTTSDLSGVAFASATAGWAAGAGGTILATTDAGVTWTPQASGTTSDLSGVAFADGAAGWAVGAGGTVLATVDGGMTWTAQTSGTAQTLHAVAVADATHALAVGDAGAIIATTDGSAWVARSSGTTSSLFGADYGNAKYAWVCGAAGTVLRSTNGGSAWTAQRSGTSAGLAAVAFTDPGRGAVAGASGVIRTTTTGGVADTSAPVTRASGLQTGAARGWRNTPQTVSLKASDAGSGVMVTYYTVDGSPRQTYAGPFEIDEPGSHRIAYWSADWARITEAKHVGFVNIDVSKPACQAIGNPTAYTGTSVKFTFRVTDAKPTCGAGQVSIAIQKNGQTKKRFTIARTTYNVTHSVSRVVSLPAGQYTWVVTARDLAGNVQSVKGHARLTLKKMPLPTMADVQRRLVQLRYLPSGAVTGKADYRTSQALMAFQAWNGLTRDGVAGVVTRKKLMSASVPTPRPASASGHYVEVFRSLGVALCIDNGTVVRAVHCSTGRPGMETTAGTWSVYLKSTRYWSEKYSSWMPYASFFHNGEGLHGYADVPAYPASHGCVRLPMPEAHWVYDFAYMGAAVIVY